MYLAHLFRLLYTIAINLDKSTDYVASIKDFIYIIGNLNTVIPKLDFQQKLKIFIRNNKSINNWINDYLQTPDAEREISKKQTKNNIIIWLYKLEYYIKNSDINSTNDEIIEIINYKYADYKITPQIINYLKEYMYKYSSNQLINEIYMKEWLQRIEKLFSII